MAIQITRHACERARERLGWSAETLDRMIDRILGFGLGVSETAGALRRYLLEHQEPAEEALVRTYGEHLYVFQRGPELGEWFLVTVWQLPASLRSGLRKARRRMLAA